MNIYENKLTEMYGHMSKLTSEQVIAEIEVFRKEVEGKFKVFFNKEHEECKTTSWKAVHSGFSDGRYLVTIIKATPTKNRITSWNIVALKVVGDRFVIEVPRGVLYGDMYPIWCSSIEDVRNALLLIIESDFFSKVFPITPQRQPKENN
jgi:hypothetical protein